MSESKHMNVSVCFSAADIYEMERVAGEYGIPRAVLVRTVMRRFMALPVGQVRAWLVEEELVEKKGKLVAEKRRLETEIARVEKDLRGCEDDTHLLPRKGGGTGEKKGAASKGG